MSRKKRSRGGASAPCPRCKGPTRVSDTRRSGEGVRRLRRCVAARCRHVFSTEEKAA
jgi:transcriptional regulator NrdR family protein